MIWIENPDGWLVNTNGWADNSLSLLIEEIVCVQDDIQIQNKIFLTENISLIDLNITKFSVSLSEGITTTDDTEVLKGVILSPNTGAATLEGNISSALTGINIEGTVGNSILSGMDATITVGASISPPTGEAVLSGLIPYLPSELDIFLYNFSPKYLAKKFITYVEFELRMPDDNAFLIEKVSARLDNEEIPIEIIINGREENKCRMAIDTNHLRDGYKKLDINVILEDNSNQFRRYVRIL